MIIMNLRNFYGILALISSLAATQSMIFPRWPEASKISEVKLGHLKANLLSNGHVIKSLPTVAGHSDYDISHTPIIGFMIDANSQLKLTNIQVRDRKNLQVSYITEPLKSLQLKNTATKSNQPPFFLSENNQQGTTFQTCFVSDSSSPSSVGFSQDQLSLAVDQAKTLESNLAIKRLLGLSPSRRYQCMLITLKTTLPSQESSKVWLSLLNHFQNTFN
jgi:hypothetical protein